MQTPASPIYVGVDVGGTFTDLLFFHYKSNSVDVIKVPTTPRNPELGIMSGLSERKGESGQIELFNHATTIATNALLTHTGIARVALLTNEGFRDILEIGRQRRPELYNLYTKRATPLVRRADRFTVRGRILFDGSEETPLDEAGVKRVAGEAEKRGFDAIAVCFLNSYVNPKHELRARELLVQCGFHGVVCLSNEVDREYREYERFSTTVVNAALSPLVSSYLNHLRTSLNSAGFASPLYVMNSSGGANTVELASRLPISVIESGPAAGVLASHHLARELSIPNVMTFDMGGTTAKAGAIENYQPDVAYEFEAAGKTHSGRSIKGSGYAVRYPFLDLAEVSAGGGTVARVDLGGRLAVGPDSAGSEPGPAAYGGGGEEATITDANIVLGKLNPSYLLGGKKLLHYGLAKQAVQEKVAQPLGLDVYSAAEGITKLANNAMTKAMSIVSIERGRDPRNFTLFAFGGAGPIHACDIADDLHISGIVVPKHPGLFSAYGLLTVDLTREFVLPVMSTNLDPERRLKELRLMATRALEEEGFQNFRFEEFLDLRYRGQSYELTLPYSKGTGSPREAFEQKHKAVYGYVSSDPVELVSVKIRSVVPMPKISVNSAKSASAAADEHENTKKPMDSRKVYLEGSFVDTPVLHREHLANGVSGLGPAIIEEYDSTTYIRPEWNWKIDEYLNIVITRREFEVA